MFERNNYVLRIIMTFGCNRLSDLGRSRIQIEAAMPIAMVKVSLSSGLLWGYEVQGLRSGQENLGWDGTKTMESLN
jgi:hypothetical protein